jgi:hypothetical protein
MHHAYSSAGMGWCPFDDIYLAVRKLRKASGGEVKRVRTLTFISVMRFSDDDGGNILTDAEFERRCCT